nr:hypothetical protein [Sphingobium sp. Sx8-8]
MPEPDPTMARPRGSLIIFALVAIALILAIGFFYLTKEGNGDQADRLIEAANSAANSSDSAAHVVGDAAKNAANALYNKH